MSTLLRKVNFTKGWPSSTIREETLPAASGVTIEMGLIGKRDFGSPEGWTLGVTDPLTLPYVFRNGSDDHDAAPDPFSGGTVYENIRYGGIHGISFDNPIEFETTQWAANSQSDLPTKGSLLFADTDGKLKVAMLANGTARGGNDRVMIARCLKAPFYIGDHYFITVEPIYGNREINQSS